LGVASDAIEVRRWLWADRERVSLVEREIPVKRKLVLLGNRGHASSVADAAESSGFTVEGLIGISSSDDQFQSLLVAIRELDLESTSLGLGIGPNHWRNTIHSEVAQAYPTAKFPSIVHASALVSPSAVLGNGAVLLAHASAGANSQIGLGALLNTGASLDHDSTLGDFASLGPGARTGGDTSIGARTMIGLQAGILQGRIVGEDTVIGAHSLVIENIPPLSVAIGTPCRPTRSRTKNEYYD